MEQRKHERNKRYGWLVLFSMINWLAIGLAVWKIDPDNISDFIFPGSYLPMGILLAGGIFWLLSIVTLSAVRALRWTLGIITFMYLRVWGLGSVFNGVLILGLMVAWEVYIYRAGTLKTIGETEH
jgi:hypothetical protein